MKEVVIHGKTFIQYIRQEQIEESIRNMAQQIKQDLQGEDPLFVCIMNGAFMFASELLKYWDGESEVDFARYSSYEGTQSTFQLKEIMPVTSSLQGRVVIVLEDLIDTGYTMKCVKDHFLNLGAKEVKIATMLLKPEALKCDIVADYVGISIDNGFIVGHGLDFDDRGRALADIYILKE